jgi:hypothetical protein
VRTACALLAMLLTACAAEAPAAPAPTLPNGFQVVGDLGYAFAVPEGWEVLEEGERQERFVAEVVGPGEQGGYVPRVALALDEGSGWRDLGALRDAVSAGPLAEQGAVVAREEPVWGLDAEALVLDTTYRVEGVHVRQFDLLMVVDGIGVDLRVAMAAPVFDEPTAWAVVRSLRLR